MAREAQTCWRHFDLLALLSALSNFPELSSPQTGAPFCFFYTCLTEGERERKEIIVPHRGSSDGAIKNRDETFDVCNLWEMRHLAFVFDVMKTSKTDGSARKETGQVFYFFNVT